MANPNVSAMSELTIGTLAWTITADQVAVMWGTAWQRGAGGYEEARPDVRTSNTYNSRSGKTTVVPNQLLVNWGSGHDGSDYPIDDSVCKYPGSSGDDATLLQDSNTGEYCVQKWSSSNYAHNFLHYWKDADFTNYSTEDNRVYFKPDDGNSMDQNVGAVTGYFGNVDQTTPFGTVHAGYPWWSTANEALQSVQPHHSIPTQIGDCILLCFAGSHFNRVNLGHMGMHSIAEFLDMNVTYYHMTTNAMHYKTPKSYSEFIAPSLHTATYEVGGANYWSYYASQSAWTILNLQSPRTKTKLFTVPSGKIIKLNNLWIANPTVSGMFASIDIEGLPSGTGGILDSSGSAVIDLTGADGTASVATVPIAQQLRAKSMGKVSALEQPLFLTEGMSVSAKVVCDENYPYLLSETAQIVADFEVVQ